MEEIHEAKEYVRIISVEKYWPLRIWEPATTGRQC